MMRLILYTICFIGYCVNLFGQGNVGSWTDHLSWSSSYYLSSGNDKIFSSAGSGLLILETDKNQLSNLSRVDGLTETRISATGWCQDEETLIIVYKNTNVDLVRKGVITNLPDIKNKYIPGLKEIYNITVTGNLAILSASFGIVVLDVGGRFVKDTWRPGPDGNINEVYETTIVGERIFAATAKGVFSAPLSAQGLAYYDNWERLSGLPFPEAMYDKIAATGSVLFLNMHYNETDVILRVIPGQPSEEVFSQEGIEVRSLDPASSGISASLDSSIVIYSDEGIPLREIKSYGWGTPNPQQTLSYNNTLYIADLSAGLVSTSDFSTFFNHVLPGPYTNNVADISFAGTTSIITGGTVDNAWGNVYRPFQVFVNSGQEWTNTILYGQDDRDAMRVVADPSDAGHFFVSSWGNGIYEFEDGTLKNNYNQYNSPLQSMTPGEAYTRICGLAFDSRGNLWMTQSGVPGSFKVLNTNGTWTTTTVNLNVLYNVPVVGDIVIDNRNMVWTILPRGHDMFVYDPGDTPDNISDDRYLKITVEDTEGHVMNNLYSIAIDRDENIWVGTDIGPAVYYTPHKVFDETIKATRIKVPRNDGSGLADYLLGTETITSIAVDGADRKWFGTMSSGAYLVSEDGKTQIHHFNTANSPLLSDNIVSIGINGEKGDVWFGTAEGTISFRGSATTGKSDYSGMYVFPNPVREDYEGPVTVTNLMENSIVKITDITGNMVFEATSSGGQASWDMHNYRGNRVSTGVYLVFVSNSDGSMSEVTKLLIIR